MAYLTVREPERVAFTFELREDTILGREPGCTIVATNTHVSRRHLRIARLDDGWLLEDLGSSHGTFLNGERVTERRRLHDRDHVQAGKVVLLFHDQATPLADTQLHPAARASVSRGGDVDARRLQLFYDVSRAIGALGDPDALMGAILDGVLEVLACERGLVCLTDGHGGLHRRVSRGADDVVLAANVVQTLREGKQSILQRMPPALAAPLSEGGRAIGFIYVAGEGRRTFTSAELELITALAALTASALDQATRQRRLRDTAEGLRADRPLAQLLGESEAILRLRQKLARVAPTMSSVLVRGETGTGKELVARTLHSLSPRADEPFIAVNCAAIPETLIESELFGHEKGAFSGAVKTRRGKLALADGGTIFLDEVADLSLGAQAKVLRAVENREIYPVGSDEPITIDVRIISATHKDIEAEIAGGRFRSDLFYRLNVVELEVPPLRERGDDVLLLADSILLRCAANLGRAGVSFDPEARVLLKRFDWPGNVRQLANEIERALLFADDQTIDLEDLRQRIDEAGGGPDNPTSVRAAERAAIERALAASGGNLVNAARALGVGRTTLYRKLKRYGLKAES